MMKTRQAGGNPVRNALADLWTALEAGKGSPTPKLIDQAQLQVEFAAEMADKYSPITEEIRNMCIVLVESTKVVTFKNANDRRVRLYDITDRENFEFAIARLHDLKDKM